MRVCWCVVRVVCAVFCLLFLFATCWCCRVVIGSDIGSAYQTYGVCECVCVYVRLPVMRGDSLIVLLTRLRVRVVPDVLACGVLMLMVGGWCVGCMRCVAVRRVAIGACISCCVGHGRLQCLDCFYVMFGE